MSWRTIEVALTANVSGFVTRMGAASASVREFGREAGGVLTSTDRQVQQSLEKTSKSALVLGGVLTAGFAVAARAAAGFEQKMSGVAAVSGATARELDLLRDAALKAGRDTAFSAAEAAQAEAELARAGVSVADILGGALTGALDLAAAGELGVADAATIAAAAMNQFALSGSDIGHVADLLAAGANATSASVQSLGEGLDNVGGVAASMGASLDDTVGVLALLEKNSVRGAEGATSLRSMLLSLAAPSGEAADTMERLGISAYDAQGSFVGFERLAGQLHERLAGLTQAQRDQALATIFGSYGIRAANALYKEGAEGVQRFTTLVNDQGAATRMASVLLDNLAGDLETLKGSVETALIEGGSQATGVLRGLTQGVTTAVNTFSGLPDVLQASVIGITGLSGGALLLVGGLGTLVPKIRTGRLELEGLGLAGMLANRAIGGLAQAGAAVGILTTVALSANSLHDALDGVDVDTTKLASALVDLGQAQDAAAADNAIARVNESAGLSYQSLADKATDAARALLGASDNGDNLTSSFKGLDTALAALVQAGNPEVAAASIERLGTASGRTVDEMTQHLPKYRDAVVEADTRTKLLADSQGRLNDKFGGLGSAVGGALGPLEEYRDVIDGIVTAASAPLDLADAEDELAAALRESSRLQDDVAAATDRLSDARDRQADAQERLNEVRAVSLEQQIEEADLAARAAGLASREAGTARLKAEDRLAQMREAGRSPQEIADQEFELERARLREAQAADASADANKHLDDVRSGRLRAREIRDAERQLAEAMRGVGEAQDAEAEAMRLAEAPTRDVERALLGVFDAASKLATDPAGLLAVLDGVKQRFPGIAAQLDELAAKFKDVNTAAAAAPTNPNINPQGGVGTAPYGPPAPALPAPAPVPKVFPDAPVVGGATVGMLEPDTFDYPLVITVDPRKPGYGVHAGARAGGYALGGVVHSTSDDGMLAWVGERRTGGEVIVPRYGITPQRGRELVGIAAGWHPPGFADGGVVLPWSAPLGVAMSDGGGLRRVEQLLQSIATRQLMPAGEGIHLHEGAVGVRQDMREVEAWLRYRARRSSD